MATSKRWRDYEEIPVSKRRRQEEQGPNWSDLPRDILEHVVGRLRCVDRIRVRAVCKAWSIPIQAAIREVPWAMKFCLSPTYINDEIKYNVGCRMIDPLSQDQDSVRVQSVREEDSLLFLDATPCASKCGWVLFKECDLYEQKIKSLFLYSPFTAEVIKLPDLGGSPAFQVATLSLESTSAKCVIFLLWARSSKIYVRLCSAGDKSWKTFEFDGFNGSNSALDATYANGVFYCVFKRGQLGAFNLALEDWTILVDYYGLPKFCLSEAKLIASESGLRMLSPKKSLQLIKLDFSKMCWVYENDLNNHVLFIGCTSFSSPAVGDTSQLANTIFSSRCSLHPSVRFYGSTSPSQSRLYDICVEATEEKMSWIELPLGVTWRANDLIHAV